MFRFEHTEYLYILMVIPVLIFFFMAMRFAGKRAVRRFGNSALMHRLMPQMSRYKHSVKFILLVLAVAFLVIGLANPQWGTKKEKVTRKSADIFIALDISQSMLAADVPPDRLKRAKRFARSLISALEGERIGMIIFAGNAYLQAPLTTDYAAINLVLESANPDMVPTQGTAISDAIDLAEKSFDEENKNHKALVIISDGENHEDEALDRAEEANANGLLLFTVGVGTPEGSFIPIRVAGRQDYKRDRTGNPVRSRLNEEMLRELAKAGEGGYFNLANDGSEVAQALQQRIDSIEKREFEQRVFNEFESYFQYFIATALILLILEFLISYKKNRYLANKDLFKI